MELLLLKLVGFLRPLASMQYAESLFEVLGVGMFGLVVMAMLVSIAVRRELMLSGVDMLILAFCAWCLAGYLIYFDLAKTSDMAKLLVPLLTYVLVKNLLHDRAGCRQLLLWIVAGFALPAVLSAALIALEHPHAVDMVMYWTGVTRWDGVYTHSHNLGHSMTLLVMVLVLYEALRDRAASATLGRRKLENALIATLSAVALYCLFMSQVRSAILGLLVFGAVYMYCLSRKLFLFGAGAFAIIAIASMPLWFGVLLHELNPSRLGGAQDITEVGSGRLEGWTNDLAVFAALPIDQKIAGAGIGVSHTVAGELFGHNDWLRLLTDTGIVGLLLFVGVQVMILRAILRLEGKERYAFLALFAAVNVMMAVSNSYALRIQVSHIYYMVLAFVQVPAMIAVSVRQPAGIAVHAR